MSAILSIVIPVYNVKPYLDRCIISVLNQNIDKIEVVLVDDGSTDGCDKICDDYSVYHNCISVVHKKNGGLSDARNVGIDNATGKYILFLDSDDYLKEQSLAPIVSFLNDDVDILATNFCSIENGIINEISYTRVDGIMTGKQYLKFQYKSRTMITSVVQNIYRRELLINNQLHFKKGIYHEDEEWTPRVFEKANSVKFLDNQYYVYAIRENSIMKSEKLIKHFSDFSQTLEDLLRHFSYLEKEDYTLYRLLKDDLVSKYLSIYARGNLCDVKIDNIQHFSFLRQDLYFLKTKLKVWIFYLNKTAFCKLSKLLRK